MNKEIAALRQRVVVAAVWTSAPRKQKYQDFTVVPPEANTERFKTLLRVIKKNGGTLTALKVGGKKSGEIAVKGMSPDFLRDFLLDYGFRFIGQGETTYRNSPITWQEKGDLILEVGDTLEGTQRAYISECRPK